MPHAARSTGGILPMGKDHARDETSAKPNIRKRCSWPPPQPTERPQQPCSISHELTTRGTRPRVVSYMARQCDSRHRRGCMNQTGAALGKWSKSRESTADPSPSPPRARYTSSKVERRFALCAITCFLLLSPSRTRPPDAPPRQSDKTHRNSKNPHPLSSRCSQRATH